MVERPLSSGEASPLNIADTRRPVEKRCWYTGASWSRVRNLHLVGQPEHSSHEERRRRQRRSWLMGYTAVGGSGQSGRCHGGVELGEESWLTKWCFCGVRGEGEVR